MDKISEIKNCEACASGTSACGCGQCGGPDCVRCKDCCGATCGANCAGCDCAKKSEGYGDQSCAFPQ